MMYRGINYMINGVGVSAPDSERWRPVVVGEALDALERRSPYYELTWTKAITDDCREDWSQFDNMVLTEFICRPPRQLNQWRAYSDATCQSVNFIMDHGVATQITAKFLVDVES